MNIRQSVFSGLKWLTMARLIAQIARWAVTFIVIRLLLPEDYGIAALAQTVLALLELFTSLGLGAAIIQSKEISKPQLQIIFGMILAINLCLFSLLWLIAPLAADFYQQPDLELVLRVLSLNFVFIVLSALPGNLLVKEMKFKLIASAEVVSGIAGAAVSLYMAYAGFGYWALIVGGQVILGTRAFFQIIARPTFVLPRFNFSQGRKFLGFGGLVMTSIIIRYLYVSLDVIIAGRVWTAETLGIYAVALQLAVLPLNKMMPMIRQVAFPAYSKTQSDPEKVKDYITKSMGIAMAICFPLFFGISSIATLIAPLVLGERWDIAGIPIMLLCLIIPFRMMLELFEPALNATGNPKTVVVTSLWILVIMTPTFLVSIQWGVIGLCLGWVIVFPPLSVFFSYRYCNFMGLPFSHIVEVIKPPLLCSGLMFGVVVGYSKLMLPLLSPWLVLSSSILVGVIVYLSAIYITDRSLLARYRNLVVSR